MATTAQALANRENAQNSTGPKTEEGKAASSRNANRHSLTARGLIIPAGMEAKFAAMEDALQGSLLPNGGIEKILFERILECAWNLERCRHAQAQLFDRTATDFSIDPLLDEQNEAKFARIDKYARQFENSMLKAMRELRTLQTETQFRDEIHPLAQEEIDDPKLFSQTPQSLSSLCDFQKVMSAARRASQSNAIQNKAEADRATFALLARLTAPPSASRSNATE